MNKIRIISYGQAFMLEYSFKRIRFIIKLQGWLDLNLTFKNGFDPIVEAIFGHVRLGKKS